MGERFNGKASFTQRAYGNERRGVTPVPERRFAHLQQQRQADLEQAQAHRAFILGQMSDRLDTGLGNRELPAFRHKRNFVATVRANKAVVAGGETGSGKSTQFPQFLYEAGFDLTVVLVPRQIIANGLTDRIREELQGFTGDVDPQEVVGVIHGDRTERHENNKILIMTPNTYLKLETDLEEAFSDKEVAVIPDEMHEANIFTEIAAASAAAAVGKHDRWHIIPTSATHNSEKITTALQEVNGGAVPSIEVKGRPFDIATHEVPDKNPMDVYADVGHDHAVSMIFTSGVRQIRHITDKTREELERRQSGSSEKVIFRSLYRELGSETISHVTDPVPEGYRLVIVSTPAGMSGITIPGLTCVITDGTINRSELDSVSVDTDDGDGIIPEGLRRRYMSRAEIIQEIGRAGRDVEGGVGYVTLPVMPKRMKAKARRALTQRRRKEDPYWLPVDDSEFLPIELREAHAPAEIYNTNLQDVTLTTAATGRRLYELRHFLQNRVEESVLLNAEESLIRIGALNDEHRASDIGMVMNRLPVMPELARGLYEAMARRRSAEQLGRAAMIAAAFDVDGFADHKAPKDVVRVRKGYIRSSTADDMIAELDIAIGLKGVEEELGRGLTDRELTRNGIRPINYERVQKTTRKILRVMGLKPEFMQLTHPTPDEERELREDFTAGFVDLVYQVAGKDTRTKKPLYRNILGTSRSTKRRLSTRSAATLSDNMTIAAVPYYYESGVDKYGRPVKYDVIGRTFIVDPEVVGRHALANGLLHYRHANSRVVDGQAVDFSQGMYGAIKVGAVRRDTPKERISQEAREALIDEVQNHPGEGLRALRSLVKELKHIRTIMPPSELAQYRQSDAPRDLSGEFLDELIHEEARKTSFAIDVDRALRQYMYSRNLSIHRYYYPDGLDEIYRRSPESITVAGAEARIYYDKNNPGKPYITMLTQEQQDAIEGPIYIDDGKREVLYQIPLAGGGTQRISFAHFAAAGYEE